MPTETLKRFDLELLTYFEGPPIQEALEGKNIIEFIKSMIIVGGAV